MKSGKVLLGAMARGGGEEGLAPLMEGPAAADEYEEEVQGRRNIMNNWVNRKTWSCRRNPMVFFQNSNKSSNYTHPPHINILLALLGSPLAPPVSAASAAAATTPSSSPHLSIRIKHHFLPIEVLSAQYIVHQYIAATGATRLHTSFHNSYVAGKVKMQVVKCKSKMAIAKSVENGRFVLWQMMPACEWYMEMALEGSRSMIQAGSNGKVVWRYTPWHGGNDAAAAASAVKGPARPLRRLLQGLNPMVTAHVFANARCIGEKRIGNEDCFVLKATVDQQQSALTTTPHTRDPDHDDSKSASAEIIIIRHVLCGCFSQRTGYLIHLEDSHLVRLEDASLYWEATIESTLKDYRIVDGVALAHSGKSIMTLHNFGGEEHSIRSHTETRLEETWSIDEVAFNVAGLSHDFFLPPSDVLSATSIPPSYHFPFITTAT